MKKLLLFFILSAACIALQHAGTTFTAAIKFADLKKAKELLGTEDVFTNSWSAFDIDSRMGKASSTKADLLKYIATQAREWTKAETKLINEIVDEVDAQIKSQGFHIEFPAEIYLVKTTVKEEGGALGYTRNNYIILKDDILNLPKEELKTIVIHELFHVLSRNNPQFRMDMYKLIGFTIIEDVAYPAQIKDLRITNPDTPLNDCYISVKYKGEKINVMMILYANKAYAGGSFFEYLQVGFLVLKDVKNKEFVYVDGKPLILGYADVDDFNEQVGSNTGYVIHPEEVLADNFIFAINNKTGLPSQWLVTNMQKALTGK